MNYNVVLPTTIRHKKNLELSLSYIEKYLSPQNIVIISKSGFELNTKVKYDFIDEDKLYCGLTYNRIREIVEKRDKYATKRTGWYYQQFLKLGYAYICQDEYFLIWDSDIIPLKPINMIENGKPVFDIIFNVFHRPMFSTINRLFQANPVIRKCDYSFVTEHMLYKKEYVIKMLDEINENNNLEGNNVFEKIVSAINVVDLLDSGFSEYETYGNYVQNRYGDEYQIRKLNSLRDGNGLYGFYPTDDNLMEAAKKYDTICFENWHMGEK